MKFSSIGATAVLASVASGHTIFCQLKTSEQIYPVSHAIRTPSYDGVGNPIQRINVSNMACNGPPNPTTPSSKIIDVKAGETVSAIWRHTLQSNDVMDPGHKGPVMAYLKKVSDATKDSGVGDGWFKIQEEGYGSGGKWGTDTVINNGGNQVIQIPECIEDGQYLLRAEMVALHGARSVNGAQLYMECAQINVTGGKATKKPTTASIPGIYKSNDPGLLIDIYGKPPGTSNPYKIPGPAVFTC
ncbi:glycoside hydrolase family 61 protein [Hypoxylon sp. CI-4A]|nr:glycoside hydrolase family 61 protein [Hypoxylon sp. CI-4A]